MKAKYVVIEHNALLQVPVMCPTDAGVSHSDLAGGKKVVSAGFCRIDGREVQAYGESIGLRIPSRGTPDAELIAKFYCGVGV